MIAKTYLKLIFPAVIVSDIRILLLIFGVCIFFYVDHCIFFYFSHASMSLRASDLTSYIFTMHNLSFLISGATNRNAEWRSQC